MAACLHLGNPWLRAAIKPISLAHPLMIKDAWDQHLLMAEFVVPNLHLRQTKVLSLAWNPPLQGWHKLHSDGGVKVNGYSSGRDIIRDQNGYFMETYSCLFDDYTVLEAEAIALLHGIQI
ncbi:hypothetical protein ACH5RR_026192 [Cinchona calisaya]|uniref:RNase H type-1 domain-containing protein n=1 Tax=Cinchona calisaya TaxID=153742 RepID=A0ABD2Z565_9GENT